MWRPPSWWVFATVVFAFSATYLLRRRSVLSSVLALASFFLAGALTIQIRGSGAGDSQVWFGDGQELFVTAHVIAEGNLQSDAPGSVHQRLDVETEQIESGTETRQVRAGVRLNIYSGENASRSSEEPGEDSPPQHHSPARMQLLRYGQRIRFSATLNPPHNFRNPGAFDYAEYLRDNGIAATASAKYAGIEMLPGFSGSRVQLWRARIHRRIIQKVHALWPEEVAGLMDAMVVGEESFINRPTRVNFQRSGTYHVLVVSGMNVSILAMFTLWTLRRVGLGDIAASACAIVLILAYAELTNVGPPVWRAALMFAVYLATRLLYRRRAMLNALGAAALALLIADPQSLFGASFQMTFLCVGLVAGVGVPVLERTIEPYSHGLRNLDAMAYDRQLAPRVAQFRLDLRLVLDRVRLMLPGKVPAMVLVGAESGVRIHRTGRHVRGAADRTRTADGVLLPSGDLGGDASEPAGNSISAVADAGSRARHCTWLCVDDARENSCGNGWSCAPGNRRHRAMARRPAARGHSCSHAKPGCNPLFGLGNYDLRSSDAQAGRTIGARNSFACGYRVLDMDHSSASTDSSWRAGDDRN